MDVLLPIAGAPGVVGLRTKARAGALGPGPPSRAHRAAEDEAGQAAGPPVMHRAQGWPWA